ncbi:DeoR/GlpR family DNA-binding transcription regulator [Mycolicibacterium palauense]|uniref:hypothetical protein n=1 Tax=Mycolicibacterium palauense TaxID=2034511 RepID=UPI001FE28C0B|nr:hypothetical protein [Mycolicibacterium palauense]
MMRRCERVYILAHADKLGRRPFHAWAPLVPGAVLVTDSAADDALIAPFLRKGIEVVRTP